MSANQSSIAASKSTNASNQTPPVQSQAGSSATGDNHGVRRFGGSGSFGAGAASRSSPSPRNSQTSKKKHKSSKRFAGADEDALAEAIAMSSTNSRKGQTSITHLMNFSLPPPPRNHHYGGQSHGRSHRRPAWGLGSGYHAVDKARYVHANYRFIVDPRADCHPQSTDADIHLDWNNVLQILASAQSQSASCPICLGTPVAPRMARCGHIFCLPCLIRFMHSENEDAKVPEKKARSKKCPLCEDKIYVSDTRPVRFYWGQEGEPPREGADVVLRLIMRPAASTLALPRDGADMLPKNQEVPWHIAAEVMDYARIMKGSEDYMMQQLDEEIEEVQRQGREDELMFGEDTSWTRKAVKMIQDAKEKFRGIGNPPAMPAKPSDTRSRKATAQTETPALGDIPSIPENAESNEAQATQSNAAEPANSAPAADSEVLPAAVPSESSNASAGQSQAVSNLSASLAEFRSRQHEHQPPSEYFFYQASLHYYLSSLDIRILKTAFGDFASFPTTILPRVERVSTGHVVDDELRKRTKYLAHLPYGCEVAFLECDWTDTVPSEILEKFKPEIDRRRKRNREKEAREEKARVRAEKEEDQKTYAQARRKRPSASDNRFTADDFQPLGSSETHGLDGDNTSSSPPYAPRRQGSAFASLASPSTSPSAPRTVWGTTAIAPTTPPLHPSSQDQEVPGDGWLQDWEKDFFPEDEMMAQVQAMSLAEGESSRSGAAANSGGGGKKKKKKITLMSTNVRRGA